MITILLASQPITKTWRGDHSSAYPDAYRWRVRTVDVRSLDELAVELERVAAYRMACVIRGVPIDEPGDDLVRRLVHPCTRTGDAPTFKSAPDGRQWICVDVDGVPTSHDPAVDPEAYADDARQALPAELASGRCYFQLSASAGMKPGARVHLWYWLEAPALDDALRAWANAVEVVDASLFGAVQPHYVVPPTFVGPHPDGWGERELPDPIPCRTGWLDGSPTVWPVGLLNVPAWHADLERAERERAMRAATQSERSRRMWDHYQTSPRARRHRADAAIASSVAEIERAGAGGRNAAICRRANFLGRVAASGALSLEEARTALVRAAENALGAEWRSRGRTTVSAIERCLESGYAAGDL